MTVELPKEPVNRKEAYLADIAGQDVELPDEPVNRIEAYLAYIAENGGGGGGGDSAVHILTTADYNYASEAGGSLDSVALWKLPAGMYFSPNLSVSVVAYLDADDQQPFYVQEGTYSVIIDGTTAYIFGYSILAGIVSEEVDTTTGYQKE